MSTHRLQLVRQAANACAQWFAVATLASAAHLAAAQNVMVYDETQTPSAQDVAEILSRGAAENIQTRGRQGTSQGSPFAALEQKPVASVKEASVLSLPLQFGFDSTDLTPQSKQQLKAIADGIKLTDGTVRVVIEGHTDAKGRISYNDRLSLRRAAAVRDHLVTAYNVPVKLLQVEGKGPHKLLDKADPFSSRNRRVQFRAG